MPLERNSKSFVKLSQNDTSLGRQQKLTQKQKFQQKAQALTCKSQNQSLKKIVFKFSKSREKSPVLDLHVFKKPKLQSTNKISTYNSLFSVHQPSKQKTVEISRFSDVVNFESESGSKTSQKKAQSTRTKELFTTESSNLKINLYDQILKEHESSNPDQELFNLIFSGSRL